MVRRVVWMVGLVDPSSLPPLLTLQGSPRSLDRYVPLNQLRASLRERWRFTPCRQPPPFAPPWGRTDVVSSTTERAATPFPPALLSNKLQLRIRAFCSIGFYLHRPRIASEVNCISVEISAPCKYPSFRGCEIDTHSIFANRILKGIDITVARGWCKMRSSGKCESCSRDAIPRWRNSISNYRKRSRI